MRLCLARALHISQGVLAGRRLPRARIVERIASLLLDGGDSADE